MNKEDRKYIKENIGINAPKTPLKKVFELLAKNHIPTTSWIVSKLMQDYGEDFAIQYIESIKDKTCGHGFLGDCPYCRYGTE